MELKDLIFYLLGAWILLTALLSITSKQIFRSAVYLLFCMMGVAGLYFWMNYEFIAAVQIVVYVGGVVVLIIFSIFLTHQVGHSLPSPKPTRRLFAGLATMFAFLFFWAVIRQYDFAEIETGSEELSVRRIGEEMLKYQDGGFALPFEVVSILLLAAMIGCIVIAMKAKPEKTESWL
jgi:NADH-quinone oxidoreductase subunit J